jgi:AAA15 family ATPase/GTPase
MPSNTNIMYLSRVIIRNYRSIEYLNVEFNKGKNVIVGKNNAGKTNLINAINLVLGEYSPTYIKSRNIDEKNFFNGDTNRTISIFCELTRDENEIFDFSAIREETSGFYKKCLPVDLSVSTIDTKDTEFDYKVAEYDESIEEICKNDPKKMDNYYINSKYCPKIPTDKYKIYINDKEFNKELDSQYVFGYLFTAKSLDHGIINKEMRLLYKEDKNTDEWSLAFTSYLRNSIMQSMILPSFRDPYNQLRITDYSWYGKLLRLLLENGDKSDFDKELQSLNESTKSIFADLTSTINDPDNGITFPNTTINMQCAPRYEDAYKQTLIYVNDGFESLLTDKGSGIQSSVIIGLFSYYTEKIISKTSALLAVEEPELYLHPHGRRIVSNQLDKFLENPKHQVIFTTHSEDFVTAPTAELTIIRVTKDKDGKTTARNVILSNIKETAIISKLQNAELFFADTVVLVEGVSDKLLLTLIAEENSSTFNLSKNWLNENNISIIAVTGKEQFKLYVPILERLGINWFIVADFDFLHTGCNTFFNAPSISKPEFDPDMSILQKIMNDMAKEVQDQVDDEKYKKSLESAEKFCERMKEGKYYINAKITPKELVGNKPKINCISEINDDILRYNVETYIEYLQNCNVFILSNDLENCYTDPFMEIINGESKSDGWKPSKEQYPLYIIHKLLPEGQNFSNYVKMDMFSDLLTKLSGYIT